MIDPTVTVAIASYNQEAFVADAIRSVLTQTFTGFELIVIDDGSTDQSVTRIRQALQAPHGGFPVRFIARENRGLPCTVNEALGLARSRYFAYLGADDVWYPTKLEKQLGAMRQHPEAAACYSDCDIIDRHGKVVDRLGRRYPYRGGDIFHDLVTMRFHPPSPTNLFVTDAVVRSGAFNEDLKVEDFNFWVRLSRRHSVVYLPEVLAAWRNHGENMTFTRHDWNRASSRATIAMAFELAPELEPERRRIEGRLQAHDADQHFNAGKLRAARALASAALRQSPLDRLAWSALVRSTLGTRVTHGIRRLRRRFGAGGPINA